MISIPNRTPVVSLMGRQFTGYFADNMGNLTTPNGTTQTVNQLNSFSVGTTTTWLFRGYFIPNVTSTTWRFRTTSDDASYLWIGTSAVNGDTTLPTGSATIDNGGLHGSRTVTSGNLSLNAGTVYAFAVVIGNNTGPGSLTVDWSTTNSNWQSNGTNLYFRNPRAANGYNL